jgi:hypothetical protein
MVFSSVFSPSSFTPSNSAFADDMMGEGSPITSVGGTSGGERSGGGSGVDMTGGPRKDK